MCGACQVTCRTYNFNLNPIQVMQELRCHFIEQGEIIPEHQFVIEGLKREGNVFGEPKKSRGEWAERLDVKDINLEKVDVLFHAGCRMSYDDELWGTARAAVKILKAAGVNVGVAGKEESCCGGRAYEMGFKGELYNYADDMVSRVRSSGASRLVTGCADCYGTFKEYYPFIERELGVEVLHITEYLDQLLKEGRIKPVRDIPLNVTYHDPCRLGRRGEKGVPWKGEYKRLAPHIFAPVPEKPMQIGLNGCYEPPRDLLKSIPGINLAEMERNRLYSWCCGSGGGVLEAFEDLAASSGLERLKEARGTGAEALVTACPWCERNFRDIAEENEIDLKIYDVVDLLYQSIEL